jgi:two-component system cell cycle response regulator DivK
MPKLILVVDDGEDNRQILHDTLASVHYEITEADNGEQALTAIARRRPDLILMDLQLAILDGYKALRHIKAAPSLSAIPIIAITSYELSEDEAKARAAGCDDFIAEPLTPHQLLAKIQEYLP